MIARLLATRDRGGHSGWLVAIAVGLAILASPKPAAGASQEYSAKRYDVSLEVLPGGDIRVSEVVTFEFQSGTFRRVWRTIPAARTDGIEVLAATMDGVPMSIGTASGQIEVSGSNRKRVEWHFDAVSASTHTFGLTYLARGVGVTNDGTDLIAWQPLPTEHGYVIAESRITAEAPSSPMDAQIVERQGVDRSTVTVKESTIEATASGVRRNGRLTLALHFPSGTIVNTQPEWRRHNEYIASLAPRWVFGAGALLFVALLFVFSLRRQQEAPAVPSIESTVVSPPEPLAPALATALVANGHPTSASGVATLLDLADRGVLVIRELPRRLGVRSYELSQVPGEHDLSPHEEAALMIAFADRGEDVTLSKAQSRLARGARRFSTAVEADLTAQGVLDESRYLVARRLKVVGITMLLVGAAAVIPVAMLINVFGGWPFLIPLAIVMGGFAGVIAGATMTVLSNSGAMRAARWRGFKRHLKLLANDSQRQDSAAVPPRYVIYAMALGLARPWSRYLKHHPAAVPPWFAAAAQDSADAGASFAAFVSTGAHGGGAGASGSAAGGGGSGAG